MARQKKIWDYAWDFTKRNKEGAIVGGIIGAIFAFFHPLYILALVAFSYFTPFGIDYMNSQALRYIIVGTGIVVGALIDQLIWPRR